MPKFIIAHDLDILFWTDNFWNRNKINSSLIYKYDTFFSLKGLPSFQQNNYNNVIKNFIKLVVYWQI